MSAQGVRNGLGAVLVAVLCCACPLLGHEEEPLGDGEGGAELSEDRIPVVDDVGPFDPSEAVDDDDGDVVLADTDDPTDASAFADETAGGDARAIEASARKRENEGEAPEPGSDGEPVAGEAEAAAREQARTQEVEAADASGAEDDEEKVEVGHNPPPEPTVESKRESGKLLDVGLETLLVAIAAALLSGALVFARSHPRTVLAGVLVLCLVAAFFLSQLE